MPWISCLSANNSNQSRYTKTGLNAPIWLLNHNEQHARYSPTDCLLEIVLETKDHLLVSPLPILRENKIIFFFFRNLKTSNFQYSKYLSNSSEVLSIAVYYSTSHSDNEQKGLLLFKSHTVGLHVNGPSMH